MACKIAGFNTHGFLPQGVHKRTGVQHTSHFFASSTKHIIHPVEEMSQMCGNALRAFEYQIDIVEERTKGDKVKVQ
jgi:hypothetical protein